jgi:predicted site-specific integrase-resolvase
MSTNNFNNMQTAKFKRAKDLAKHLGVGLSTIWKWAKDGKIKPIKLSERVTVFNVEDTERALFGEVA